MASTVRFPDDLKAEADRYAEHLGVSFSALLAVALRDYLDARKSPGKPSQAALDALTPVGPGEAMPATFRAPKNPRAPCSCGSGQQWRHCHGKLNA